MAPIEFLRLIESYATILSLVILSITSIIFGYVIPHRIENSIEELESAINEKKVFFDGLQSDINQFQNWEARGMALRDTRQVLESVNLITKNDIISKNISAKIEETIAVKTFSILAISQKLNIPKEEINSWKNLDFDNLEKKKIELLEKWKDTSGSILSDINSLNESINSKKRLKTKIVLGTLILQTFGTYLSFIGSGT